MRKYLLVLLSVILLTGFGDGDAINNGKGNGYFKKGKFKKAAEYYARIKSTKNKLIGEFNRGNALLKEGDVKKGFSLLNDVVENGNRGIASKAYYNMGNSLFRMKKYAQAANMYVNALKLEPGMKNAKYNLEKSLRMIKKNRNKRKNNKKNRNKNNKNKKDNKKQNENNKNRNNNRNKNKNKNKNKGPNRGTKKMSKQEAERILNALMRNRKSIKKDSTAYIKFLNPRYTW